MTDSELRQTFKDVMATVPTPVSIVTSMTGDALPCGATVSAFASLSIDPAMVLVSLGRASTTLQAIRASRRFGLNVLAAGQADLAMSFATKAGPEKFHGVDWRIEHGVPRLAQAPAWIVASVSDLVGAGDHVIVLGHVHAAETQPETAVNAKPKPDVKAELTAETGVGGGTKAGKNGGGAEVEPDIVTGSGECAAPLIYHRRRFTTMRPGSSTG